MEIVAEYKFGNATVRICSDAYKNLTQEHNERNRRHAQHVAWDILEKCELYKCYDVGECCGDCSAGNEKPSERPRTQTKQAENGRGV